MRGCAGTVLERGTCSRKLLHDTKGLMEVRAGLKETAPTYKYEELSLHERLKFVLVTGAWKWINPDLGDEMDTLRCTGALGEVLTKVPLQLTVTKEGGRCADKRTPGKEPTHICPAAFAFGSRSEGGGGKNGCSLWDRNSLKGACVRACEDVLTVHPTETCFVTP